ncbi:MAG: cyclase family protein [Bdellovibrionales bacterium]
MVQDIFENKSVYDISPLISEKTAVFPGDVPFQRNIAMSMESGDHLTLSSINTTVHIGAHTDAPNHYHAEGDAIHEVDLDAYMGLAQVIELDLTPNERITPNHLEGIEVVAPRVLFKTNSFPNPNHWVNDFNSLTPELIEYLAAKKVKLVGIDTPSVDPAEAKELTTHHAIYKNNLRILEGIVLTRVSAGVYVLVALPLPLEGADASPVRAILVGEK